MMIMEIAFLSAILKDALLNENLMPTTIAPLLIVLMVF